MQFLQQLNRNGETGVQKIKEFIQGNIVSIVIISACAFFVLGCWLLYTANRTENDNYNVTQSIQQAERDNREASKQVGNAAGEIKHAQGKLNDGIKRTDEISGTVKRAKKRIDDNTEIVRECNDIIDAGRADSAEARSIFADIDERNKSTGTQADGRT